MPEQISESLPSRIYGLVLRKDSATLKQITKLTTPNKLLFIRRVSKKILFLLESFSGSYLSSTIDDKIKAHLPSLSSRKRDKIIKWTGLRSVVSAYNETR